MRLLTAVSLVRAQLEEPRQITGVGSIPQYMVYIYCPRNTVKGSVRFGGVMGAQLFDSFL